MWTLAKVIYTSDNQMQVMTSAQSWIQCFFFNVELRMINRGTSTGTSTNHDVQVQHSHPSGAVQIGAFLIFPVLMASSSYSYRLSDYSRQSRQDHPSSSGQR